GYLKSSFPYLYEFDFFKWKLDNTYANIESVSWWDYQWELLRRVNSGLAIVPQRNLIINIGLGADATHTLSESGVGADLRFEELDFPLKHPEFVLQDGRKDELFFRKAFTTPSSRIKSRIKNLFPVLRRIA
ncbi:MAG: nucleotide-diphospho-sugar transferase, partial [Marivirga sp.]|nr:nucleotide-diphospho-sugar transferase [Marivirga sp.]